MGELLSARRTTRIAAAALLALVGVARAEVKTKVIDYTQGDTPLQGFLAWDDAAKGKRPGVLVIHEAWGENEHARNQALRLAKAGYVGFALDMHGNGKVATHLDDAKAFMQEASKDSAVLRARFEAALKVLQEQPQVDPKKIGAVGYCFGGGWRWAWRAPASPSPPCPRSTRPCRRPKGRRPGR